MSLCKMKDKNTFSRDKSRHEKKDTSARLNEAEPNPYPDVHEPSYKSRTKSHNPRTTKTQSRDLSRVVKKDWSRTRTHLGVNRTRTDLSNVNQALTTNQKQFALASYKF